MARKHTGGGLRSIAVLALVLLAYLGLSSVAARTKPPFNDEAWLASPALNLATHGHMGTTVLEGTNTWLEGIDRHTYWVMPLYVPVQAGWYRIVGFSYRTMRLATALWGCVLLVALWLLLRSREHVGTAPLWAPALLGLDYFFIQLGAVGRMDMMSAALGFAGLAAFASLRKRSLMLAAFTANLLTAASFFTHPYGLLHVAGLVFLMLYYERPRLTGWIVCNSAIPYLAIGLAWALYVAEEPANFVQQFSGNAAARQSFSLLPWTALQQEIVGRWLTTYGLVGRDTAADLAKAIFLVVPVGGLLTCLGIGAIRSQRDNRALLWLTGIYFVLLTYFEVKRSGLYLVAFLPLLAACAGMALEWAWAEFPRRRALLLTSVCVFAAMHVTAIGLFAVSDTYSQRYLPVTRFLNQDVAADEIVMGRAEIAFEIGFDRVLDDVRLGYHTGKRPRVIVIGNEYRRYFQSFSYTEPEVRAHIQELLDEEYEKSYSDPYYDVYTRVDPNR